MQKSLIHRDIIDTVKIEDGVNQIYFNGNKRVSSVYCDRVYKVSNSSYFTDSQLYKFHLWSQAIGGVTYFDVVRGFSHLKKHREVVETGLDQIIVKTRDVTTEGFDCGNFYIRMDLNKNNMKTILAEPAENNTLMGTRKSWHPHIYDIGSSALRYSKQCHVCMGDAINPYRYAMSRCDFTEALGILEDMLEDTLWHEGVCVYRCACSVCDTTYFNENDYYNGASGKCPDCQE